MDPVCFDCARREGEMAKPRRMIKAPSDFNFMRLLLSLLKNSSGKQWSTSELSLSLSKLWAKELGEIKRFF
jgi:hypothetical protein